MGIADIPTSLGSSFLIRTFFPGFIASLLYYLTFWPLVMRSSFFSTSMAANATTNVTSAFSGVPEISSAAFLDVIAALTILGFILGMMLTELDVQIYQLFESLRFWPEAIWNWRFNTVLKKFTEVDEGLKAIKLRKKEIMQMGEGYCDEEFRRLAVLESELSAKAREFPYNPDKNSFCRRYPDVATRFGNVIAEYENYPEAQYGMHMMVFWQHLWLILPAEVKEDLDLRGAKVDFLVYLSIISLSYVFAGGAAFLVQNNLTGAMICMIVSFLIFSLFHQASISSVKNYGRYIKAVFDLYRFDLAEKMGMEISTKQLIPDDEEVKNWRRLRRYLLDYKK